MDTVFPQSRAWLELDRAALRHNIEVLNARLPQGCRLMAVVKANGYGHGAVPVALECQAKGVEAFCVATSQEGVELRESGITGEILVLGYTHPTLAPLLHRYRLTQTVLDSDYAEELNRQGLPLDVHVKIDTGMHRLGEPWDKIEDIAWIFTLSRLRVTGLYTHLCTSSGTAPADAAFTRAQSRAFHDCVTALKARGLTVPRVHAMASYGLINYPETGGDYARVGIALYGVLGTKADTQTSTVGLRPVLSLKARVAQVRTLRAGESAGYDLKFTAQRETKLAVLTIGYADGLPRALSQGVGSVLIRGQRAPIAGRVCMDQTLVDVTDIPGVAPGDTAVLIGRSEEREISACDLAGQTGTISYEILSRLSARLERVVV